MASVGFRWLDILEKEFDKAFVDLDLEIGELHYDEPELVYNVRQKLCTLNSCFAQLTHKAQTIFQNSAKIEAELIHMRAELVESKSKRELLEKELHNLLLHLHSSQLSQLPNNSAHNKQDASFKPDVNNIKMKMQEELKKSPTHITKCKEGGEELAFNKSLLEMTQLKTENGQLHMENAALRNRILALNSEVYGAKLAAKYLDKELAGRIQQLQLLGREMRGDVRDKLWRQLESEILLQRHKTVVRECRRNSLMGSSADKQCPKPDLAEHNNGHNFGDVRTVIVKRKPGQGLGISITGGREHGVPILISELEPNGPAAISGQLYIGDAILSVNDRDLRQACHREAVDILKQQSEDCVLLVQYIAADDSDNSLEEEGFNFRYKFFDSEVCDTNDSINLHPLRPTDNMINTPTAPRTPESSSQGSSRSVDDFNSPKVYKQALIGDTQCILDEPNTILAFEGTTDLTPQLDNAILTQTVDNAVLTNKLNNINNNLIELDNYASQQEHMNRSNNSLNSENLSSPMQTSTDIFIDSELLSTDLTSNDSQSPKNIVASDTTDGSQRAFTFESIKKTELDLYASTETFSNTKSDQSLLNSEESSASSSPARTNLTRGYKKPSGKKHKPKKYFGVKTLQSIFSKYDGYSDVSSTASGDFGDDLLTTTNQKLKENNENDNDNGNGNGTGNESDNEIVKPSCVETSAQFEENIHSFLSEMFTKNFSHLEQQLQQREQQVPSSITVSKTIGNKKHFKMYGQQLRVGKALRLCPNDDVSTRNLTETERKEKLLARYVYNANSIGADGVGDPDFGTPV